MKPDENDPDVDRLFDGLEPAPPPAELRSKALIAARARSALQSRADVWSVLWNHRGLRLAWAATILVLLAGHIVVSSPDFGPAVDPALVAEHRGDEYLGAFLGPARISEDVQPIVGLFAAAESLAELDLQRNPS